MSELKPCPFCGSTRVQVLEACDEYWVRCDDCRATSRMESRRELTIAAWNLRAGHQPADAPEKFEAPKTVIVSKELTIDGVKTSWTEEVENPRTEPADAEWDDYGEKYISVVQRFRAAVGQLDEAIQTMAHLTPPKLAVPPGYALVPVKLTAAMTEAHRQIEDGPLRSYQEAWDLVLAAAQEEQT